MRIQIVSWKAEKLTTGLCTLIVDDRTLLGVVQNLAANDALQVMEDQLQRRLWLELIDAQYAFRFPIAEEDSVFEQI